mmetsp:Transcript_17172/g.47926  ORF Transcript_17172/g.47926 Transcript_17172/m.47926 type:complete len:170 (-) Transcript_17172:165-674(-)
MRTNRMCRHSSLQPPELLPGLQEQLGVAPSMMRCFFSEPSSLRMKEVGPDLCTRYSRVFCIASISSTTSCGGFGLHGFSLSDIVLVSHRELLPSFRQVSSKTFLSALRRSFLDLTPQEIGTPNVRSYAPDSGGAEAQTPAANVLGPGAGAGDSVRVRSSVDGEKDTSTT